MPISENTPPGLLGRKDPINSERWKGFVLIRGCFQNFHLVVFVVSGVFVVPRNTRICKFLKGGCFQNFVSWVRGLCGFRGFECEKNKKLQQFQKVTCILPPRNLGKSHGPSQNLAEPRRTLEETSAEASKNPSQRPISRRAPQRVVPLGWWPSGTLETTPFLNNPLPKQPPSSTLIDSCSLLDLVSVAH